MASERGLTLNNGVGLPALGLGVLQSPPADTAAAVAGIMTPEQVAAIDALDTGVRHGPEPESITLDRYGMPIPEA